MRMSRWPLVLASAALSAAPWLSAARAVAGPTQIDLAAAPTIKLAVRGVGWMRVSQPALSAAGLDAGVDPGQLHLYADGIEQAIRVTGNGDSTFDPDEAIEFY